MCLGKAQVSLGICPVWSESLLSAWRKLGYLATHWAHNKDSDRRLGWCPGWSEYSLGAQFILLVLSWGGSNHRQTIISPDKKITYFTQVKKVGVTHSSTWRTLKGVPLFFRVQLQYIFNINFLSLKFSSKVYKSNWFLFADGFAFSQEEHGTIAQVNTFFSKQDLNYAFPFIMLLI